MEVEAQHLNFLDSLGSSSINEILESWNDFCLKIEVLLNSRENIYSASEFTPCISLLCKFGLDCLVQEHILHVVEEKIIKRVVAKFWNHFQSYSDGAALKTNRTHFLQIPETLCESLEEICSEKLHQERCLLMLGHAIQSCNANSEMENLRQEIVTNCLLSRFQLMVSSILMTTLPRNFPDILQIYFTVKLEELSTVIVEEYEQTHTFQSTVLTDIGESCMSSSNISDIVEINCSTMDTTNNNLVKNIGKVVYELRSLGFASMAEDAYASAIFFLLKKKVLTLAGDDYRNPALDSIKEWIQVVPLSFLCDLLAYLGDSTGCEYISIPKSPLVTQPTCYTGMLIPSEELVRWKLRLEYFAYETLQELRIEKLFDIIVDYPDSSPAIEDLKNCLEYTGQHSKLVDSFISALKYRLLTAGASTNDILHQYVSTIRALRTIDPAGVFLEAVGEPIRDYLKGRTDTIKCIVTMLTDGTGGNASGGVNNGDSLLEELNRVAENQETIDVEEEFNSDEKQAWINAECWEPDPVEADPSKSSMNRRKFNLLGMIVNIIGSKDQLVNEYRVMLAEKLLNKSDFDLDSEIRTLELLKIHFGENSMQRCEIMLNDLLDSKRTNTNIKASTACKGVKEGNMELSLDLIDATIISSNFWPPIQDENLKIPPSTDVLLSDYARRFHEIKTPRKLSWKKNLGVVKLELEFENQTLQFSVTPMHATIIMKFQEQASWTSKNLADAIGVSTETLNRRINFWINKGIVMESSTPQEPEDHIFTLVEDVGDTIHNGTHGGRFDEVMVADEEGDRAVASVQEQLLKEMTVYEKFITGMLTNFGSMSLDRIHNTLKMFCVSDPSYDKSLHQLQSFLSGLLSEEKLELRDGMYFLKK